MPATFTRTDADFHSAGVRCAGWFYRPDTGRPPPVVVMAHGFGAPRPTGRLSEVFPDGKTVTSQQGGAAPARGAR